MTAYSLFQTGEGRLHEVRRMDGWMEWGSYRRCVFFTYLAVDVYEIRGRKHRRCVFVKCIEDSLRLLSDGTPLRGIGA
jgi:hypothetical protein